MTSEQMSPLPILKQCPVCASEYEEDGTSVIEESEEAEVLHLSCRNCRVALLVCNVESPLGMSSIGTLTDLSADDTRRFRERDSFTSDDVLDLHEFLERHISTFPHLFHKR